MKINLRKIGTAALACILSLSSAAAAALRLLASSA